MDRNKWHKATIVDQSKAISSFCCNLGNKFTCLFEDEDDDLQEEDEDDDCFS